jgi:LuxR family maltose regulon positive regulatory protein
VIVVAAPPGYGKTTAVVRWLAEHAAGAAWLACSDRDDDPVSLVADLVAALDRADALSADDRRALSAFGADAATLIPRLEHALGALPEGFAVVFDDVHRISDPEAVRVIESCCDAISPGAHLVLVGRREPPIGVPRRTAGGTLDVIGFDDLRMDRDDGVALLRSEALAVDDATAERLVETTEGWPGVLYLVSHVLARSEDPATAAARVLDESRTVADYLESEVLAEFPPDVADFMVRTAVLDELSADLCDHALGISGSGAFLERLAHQHRLVIPDDADGRSYRYHHLLRGFLRSRTTRLDPSSLRAVHERASEWFEARGAFDDAIVHAFAADQRDRVTRLIWAIGPAYVASGRTATVLRWLDGFPAEVVRTDPVLVVMAGWTALTAGQTDEMDGWTALAEELPDPTLPDGSDFVGAVALLRAMVGSGGLAAARDDAAVAFAAHAPGTIFRPLAKLLEGVARRLLGDDDGARACLHDAVRLGAIAAPAPAAQAEAQLALLAAGAGDSPAASDLIDRSLDRITDHLLGEEPEFAIPFAAAALVHSQNGSLDRAIEEAKQAQRLLERTRGIVPFAVAEARLHLARVAMARADFPTARAMLAEAERLIVGATDTGILPTVLGSAQAELAERARIGPIGAPGLSAAEARVLQRLPTHMTFGEIADDLFVSRNTVKTQAVAVYRKLGVTSRAEAVERARSLGLLEP